MKRIIVIVSLLIVMVTVIVFVFAKYRAKQQDYEKYMFVPTFVYKTVNNQTQSTANLPKYNGYVIKVFYPGCEVCQEEAANFAKHNESMQDILFVMLSPDSISKIKDFAVKQNLYNVDNFIFGHINDDMIVKNFGHIPIPILFIYGYDKKLIERKQFTNSANILSYFKN